MQEIDWNWVLVWPELTEWYDAHSTNRRFAAQDIKYNVFQSAEVLSSRCVSVSFTNFILDLDYIRLD